MSRWKRFRQSFEYGGVAFLMALIRILPLPIMRPIGAWLGWLAYRLFGVRKQVSMENVRRALGPELSEKKIHSICTRSYMNFGRSLVEFAAFKKLKKDDINAIVSFEGLEHFDAALQKGRGAVLFAGHFGNWELLGAGIAASGYPVHFLVGEQSNKQVDDLMNSLRVSQGIGIISKDVALKKVLRALKNNQFVALLADQDARKAGVFIDFFGVPASTVKGPATFAIRQGCPVVPGFIIRTEGGGHRAFIEPPLWPNPDLEGEEAIRDLTQRFTDYLTDYIRRYPDHYFWPHRRWKTKRIEH